MIFSTTFLLFLDCFGRILSAKPSSLQVTHKEIRNAYSRVSKKELAAIKLAKSRLSKSETLLKKNLKGIIIKNNGIKISKNFIPISSVGCYVPGGLARYPSSAVMSIIPAKIAGVKRIAVTSPPNSKGQIDPLTLVAADICGANEIYKTGGAQAIAALSYGTKTISKVDKIVGPGGTFVTIAKNLVSEQTGIDMLAGPTELGIIVDETANPEFVASDLISQAEHSKDTFCYAITKSRKIACAIIKQLTNIVKNSERQEILKTSLRNGFIAVCKNDSAIVNLANLLAPEHLEIMTKNPKKNHKKNYNPWFSTNRYEYTIFCQ